MSKFLQLALNNKKEIVSIFQVETGLKCSCICPECGEPLEARNKGKSENAPLKPKKKRAYFAHVSGKICKYAGETAIHLLAKEILKQNKKLTIPYLSKEGNKLLRKSKVVVFVFVETEKLYSQGEIKIIPDAATIDENNTPLFVEFKKTNPVSIDKKEKIRKIGVKTIEISLSFIEPLKNGTPNISELQEFIEESKFGREWIYNAEQEQLLIWEKEEEEKEKAKAEEIKQKQIAFEERLRKEEKDREEEEEVKRYNEEQLKKFQQEAEIEKRIKIILKKGYEYIQVYIQSSNNIEYVICPKEKKPENKKMLVNCMKCEFYGNLQYSLEGKSWKDDFCGFKAGLRPKEEN